MPELWLIEGSEASCQKGLPRLERSGFLPLAVTAFCWRGFALGLRSLVLACTVFLCWSPAEARAAAELCESFIEESPNFTSVEAEPILSEDLADSAQYLDKRRGGENVPGYSSLRGSSEIAPLPIRGSSSQRWLLSSSTGAGTSILSHGCYESLNDTEPGSDTQRLKGALEHRFLATLEFSNNSLQFPVIEEAGQQRTQTSLSKRAGVLGLVERPPR